MISIVIPAHNEETLVGTTLRAVQRAVAGLDQPHEIIVVDDASTDATAAVARAHGARVVPVVHRQIAATRNAGARAARGELLLFIDADTLVTGAVVRGAVAAMAAGAAGGGCAFRFDGRLPAYARAMQAVAVPAYRLMRLASGCCLFCTAQAFDAVGGFDQRLFAAEEAAMSRALGRQGRFVVLRAAVMTSGRKLRTFSGREILGPLVRMALSGGRSFQRREGLDIWYGERRDDVRDGHSEARPTAGASRS